MNDFSAANTLEITTALAEAAEEILEDFAEDAELDVALVVDRSGALVAGISADEDIHTETVGALVAGTVGAGHALGKVIGETRGLETVHHGEEKTSYLREMDDRFILVGISESGLPAGIIREKAAQISRPLLELLTGEDIPEQEAPNPFELTGSAAPHHEQPAEEQVVENEDPKIPPLVVDSPFEIADESEDEAEEAIFEIGGGNDEENEADSGEVIFELGGSENEEENEAEPEAVYQLGGDEAGEDETVEANSDSGESDDEEEEEVVSAPLLVEPAMSSAEEIAKKLEEDATTAVAAISAPIETDILKKDASEDDVPPPIDDEDEISEVEDIANSDDEGDDEEDDEPVGGPRYVFEIG